MRMHNIHIQTLLYYIYCCLSLTTFTTAVASSNGESCFTEQCPDGWVYFRGSCYFFVDNVSVDWTGAAHHCSLHHATLATIENMAEDLFLQGYLKKLFRNPADRGITQVSFWLGATDETVEGLWAWYTDDSDLTYTNWLPGQPDTYLGHDEDCLHLFGPNDFEWGDAQCSRKAHPLCELKLNREVPDILIG